MADAMKIGHWDTVFKLTRTAEGLPETKLEVRFTALNTDLPEAIRLLINEHRQFTGVERKAALVASHLTWKFRSYPYSVPREVPKSTVISLCEILDNQPATTTLAEAALAGLRETDEGSAL